MVRLRPAAAGPRPSVETRPSWPRSPSARSWPWWSPTGRSACGCGPRSWSSPSCCSARPSAGWSTCSTSRPTSAGGPAGTGTGSGARWRAPPSCGARRGWDFLFHWIMVHIPHHVDMAIPCYRLPEAGAGHRRGVPRRGRGAPRSGSRTTWPPPGPASSTTGTPAAGSGQPVEQHHLTDPTYARRRGVRVQRDQDL